MKGDSMRRTARPGYRWGLTGLIVVAAAMVFGGGSAVAGPVSGAVSTTDNPGFVDANNPDGVDGACLNGPSHTTPQVNCNIYTDKTDVWLSGLPVSASLSLGVSSANGLRSSASLYGRSSSDASRIPAGP